MSVEKNVLNGILVQCNDCGEVRFFEGLTMETHDDYCYNEYCMSNDIRVHEVTITKTREIMRKSTFSEGVFKAPYFLNKVVSFFDNKKEEEEEES